jgi:hypothetical protein
LPFACDAGLAGKDGQLVAWCPRRRHLKHPPCLESRSRSSGVSFLGMDDRVWMVSSSMGVAVEAGGVGGLQWCRWRLFGVVVAL